MDKTALHKLSYGLYLASAKSGEKYCGCVVDAFIQAATAPLTVILCSMKNNKTNEAIKESGEFGISVLSKDVNPFYIAAFGFQSSRDVDKWSLVPHTFLNGLPVLKESPAVLTAKVYDMKELESHTVFFAEVTEAVKGEGEPLIYGDYLKGDMKKQAFDAFKEYKNSLIKQ